MMDIIRELEILEKNVREAGTFQHTPTSVGTDPSLIRLADAIAKTRKDIILEIAH